VAGTAADILRAARARGGISQRRLAVRAGTSQDAISRIERGAEVPSVERLRRLLLALGEDLELRSVALVPGVAAGEPRRLTAAERLRESASWNRAATTLELAGESARAAGHPATRLPGEHGDG
jgi:transcriptional regulator with XRE-family HTH domain